MTERLYRSRKNRILGGVCSGLANYFKIDPVLIRVLFVLFVIFKGFGVLLYIILWIIMPEEPVLFNYYSTNTDKATDATNEKTSESTVNDNNSDSNSNESKMNSDYKPNFTINEIPNPKSNKSSFIGGIILIAGGFLLLFDNLFDIIDRIDIFPLLFIGIGIYLIYNYSKK
jgi:phage shock protein C